tara:strand:+ start:148 stop:546 length:399 start_codon:yes stop_codon:yes gene_type:complete
MKQIFHKYTEWEDFQNGMFKTKVENEQYLIVKSVELLSDEIEFYKVCLNVLDNWLKSSDVNLSNKNSNRQSWIGQAACCYAFRTPETITRKAWGLLDLKTKLKANLVADKIIKIYEEKDRKIHCRLGEKMLF